MNNSLIGHEPLPETGRFLSVCFVPVGFQKNRQESETIPVAVENPTGINAGITVGLGITDGNDKTVRNHHPKS